MNLVEAERLAHNLMAKHGILYHGWTFNFDNGKRRFGLCHYTRKRIQLSRHLTLLNDEAQVKDVILHEIAHALTPGHGHGYGWKRKCVEIGARPERCYRSSEVNTPKREVTGVCPNCSIVFKRHRRRKIACTKCCNKHNYGRYTEKFLVKWN